MMTKNDVREMYAEKFGGNCPAPAELAMSSLMEDERGIYNGATALLTGEIVYLTREEIIKDINGGLEAQIRYAQSIMTAWDAPRADPDGISLESI